MIVQLIKGSSPTSITAQQHIHIVYSDSEHKAIQEKRLLVEHPKLHYYQGLHDIVITFLLVMGEENTYAIMSMLVNYHIRCRWRVMCTSQLVC